MRSGIARWARRAGVTVMAVMLLAAAAVLGAGPAAAQQTAVVNIYVVKSPQQNGGRPDSLRQAAARTLGDASRAGEIFTLNRGRIQADGGTLNAPTDQLHPGWLLRLPPDARGPDVRQGRLTGASAGADQAASTGVQIPLVLAVVAGIVLLEVTLALVFRRQLARGLRALGRQIAAAWARLLEPFRRRRALRRNRDLAGTWHQDDRALDIASSVFDELGRTGRRPVAAEVHSTLVLTHTVTGAALPPPWQEGDPRTWLRPLDGLTQTNGSGPPVARVGGNDGYQVMLDLGWCDSAIAVDGPARLSQELAATVLRGIMRRTGLEIAVLGAVDGLQGPVRTLSGIDELESVIRSPSPAAPVGGLLDAGARYRSLRGIVAVCGVDVQTAVEAAALCARPGSGWLALVVGAPITAHWRWTVHGDGTVAVSMLEKPLVAAL